MYIALVADNIADRKQLERLLGRANDVLAGTTGTLYIDAYGDAKSLLHAPMKYELIFIDITSDETLCKSIVEQLKAVGAPASIAICQPENTPFSYQDAIDGLTSISKPIATAPLHQMILDAHKAYLQASVPTIEIRSETETYYVPIDKILYAQSHEHLVYVHLEDGKQLSMLGEIEDFHRWVSNYPEFFLVKKDTVLNQNYVLSHTKKEYHLANGECITLPHFTDFLHFSHQPS
jgi:DNA-binding LytR/AlgR family response regulator